MAAVSKRTSFWRGFLAGLGGPANYLRYLEHEAGVADGCPAVMPQTLECEVPDAIEHLPARILGREPIVSVGASQAAAAADRRATGFPPGPTTTAVELAGRRSRRSFQTSNNGPDDGTMVVDTVGFFPAASFDVRMVNGSTGLPTEWRPSGQFIGENYVVSSSKAEREMKPLAGRSASPADTVDPGSVVAASA